MESIWSKTVEIPEREPMANLHGTEVAVIGAGLAGLLTAYFLQRQGREVTVLEAERIAGGQSRNTTAKITSQHGLIYEKLIRKYGAEKARLYGLAHEQAIRKYAKLIAHEGWECHFGQTASYLYGLQDTAALRREFTAAKYLGLPAEWVEHLDLPFADKGAVRFTGQAQFHPLEFIRHLSKKLTVYEHTQVQAVHGHQIMTNRGRLYAEHIVFAGGYPFLRVPGFYFMRQHQERSYVMAVSGVKKWEGMYYCPEPGGLSFRWYEDLLLVGGGGHRVGKMEEPCGYHELGRKVGELFPQGRLCAEWAAQDCVTHDMLPFIGNFSALRPYWYVATGFKKWGMTGSMVAAELLCDLICGAENPYQPLFTPQRLGSGGSQLWEDLKISVCGLAKGWMYLPLFKGKKPGREQAKITRTGIVKRGIYRDGRGTLHETSVQCPHMGCELTWNDQEKSWDCPCHGSRYDIYGRRMDGPSVEPRIPSTEVAP